MNNNHVDHSAGFPELQQPNATLHRIAEAFVAPEYARAAFALVRQLVRESGDAAGFGHATVITAPHEYSNIVVTVGSWWLMNFHIAEAESLEEGDDVEDIVADDFEEVLEEEAAEEVLEVSAEPVADEGEEGEDMDGELIESTFYQVGTFLLDGLVISHEAIFEREDMDCYAYDFPEERISGERFYWARLVWEPEDLAGEDFLNAARSAFQFVLAEHAADSTFAEYHDHDFAKLVLDEALCERALAATDFGDVIVIEGTDE